MRLTITRQAIALTDPSHASGADGALGRLSGGDYR